MKYKCRCNHTYYELNITQDQQLINKTTQHLQLVLNICVCFEVSAKSSIQPATQPMQSKPPRSANISTRLSGLTSENHLEDPQISFSHLHLPSYNFQFSLVNSLSFLLLLMLNIHFSYVVPLQPPPYDKVCHTSRSKI